MKKLVLAAALVGAASAVSAGSLADPVVEPIIVQEAAGASDGILLPLLLLVLVAAAAAGN